MSQRGKTPSGHPLVNSRKIVIPELHLDESTPHIYVYLVPLEEREIKESRAKLLTQSNQKLPTRQKQAEKKIKSQNIEIKI